MSGVGETRFDGKQPYRFEGEVSGSVLREGENGLAVRNMGDTGVYSLVFLDRFLVEYPQRSPLMGNVADIAESFLGEHGVQRILLRQEGAATRGKILDAFNRGASFMSYVGHGGATWDWAIRFSQPRRTTHSRARCRSCLPSTGSSETRG